MVQRNFIIGSEWLYYKIYIGTKTADTLLASIEPFMEKLVEDGHIDKWFFIRYTDPHFHIRLRLHIINPAVDMSLVVNTLYHAFEPYTIAALISDIQVNTYKRELERYGEETVEEAESLFHLNSIFIINLVNSIGEDSTQRWLWGMKYIAVLLDDFGLNLDQKKYLMQHLATSYGEEFGSNAQTKKQLGHKFRQYRNEINSCLEDTDPILLELLSDHTLHSKRIITDILKKARININDLLSSYLHMHCNRLFQTKQRANEWVLYDLLSMYYQSKSAREKKENNTIKGGSRKSLQE